MLAIKSLRVLILSSLLSIWFFGIGSWSDFFLGFPVWGPLPDNMQAVSSNTVPGQGDDNPKEKTENQFRQKQTFLNSVNQKDDRTVNHSEGHGSP